MAMLSLLAHKNLWGLNELIHAVYIAVYSKYIVAIVEYIACGSILSCLSLNFFRSTSKCIWQQSLFFPCIYVKYSILTNVWSVIASIETPKFSMQYKSLSTTHNFFKDFEILGSAFWMTQLWVSDLAAFLPEHRDEWHSLSSIFFSN